MDSKLRCVFVLPDDSNGYATNGVDPVAVGKPSSVSASIKVRETTSQVFKLKATLSRTCLS
jgi:hypothetical protein